MLLAKSVFSCNDHPGDSDGHEALILLLCIFRLRFGVETDTGKELVFLSTVSEAAFWLALIKSGLPSAFISAAMTQKGNVPTVAIVLEPYLKLALLVNIDNVPPKPLSEFALIKSSLPSPFRSATVTPSGSAGFAPNGGSERVALSTNPPLPLFVTTANVLALKFAVIKSGFPSPFTSAVTIQLGPPTTAIVELVVNFAPPLL